jgi:hypothetical protein
MKGDLRDVRVQFLIVAVVLLLVDAVAAGLLLSPGVRARGAEYEQLRVEKMEKAEATAPAKGMDQKIEAAREQEATFREERLTNRYSTMSEQISGIAKDAGVTVLHVKYDQHNEGKNVPATYEEVGINVQIQGSYDQNIRFINTLERQKYMLLIDGVSFGGMQGDSLTVSLHLSTYLRNRT